MLEGPEQKLLERLKRRDERAFNELVRTYESRVYHLVLRMLGDPSEAEDVSQEIFVTVFKSIDGFRGDSKLSTWLYRVATNHCKNRIKYLRRRGRGSERQLDETADGEALASATMSTAAQLPRPDDMAQGRQTEAIVQRALGSLPEDQRELIVLRDVENLRYEEIQQVTGLPIGTVKSRLHRARSALQAAVDALRHPHPRAEAPAEAPLGGEP